MEFLSVRQLCVSYRAIQAVVDVSFDVPQGKILTLIGANGAGKTSILRALTGLTPISSGEILFKGSSLKSKEPHQIVKQKICHVPEGRGIFLNLSVEENLDLGAYSRKDHSSLKDDLEHVFTLFPRIKERRKQNAGTLSGGEQQMLAIGRALMSRPEVLLLDEPSLGLAPQIIEKIFEIIQSINKEGKTVLLVEQNAKMALEIADDGLVLETGHIVLKGPAKDLLQSDQVRKAYLGGD